MKHQLVRWLCVSAGAGLVLPLLFLLIVKALSNRVWNYPVNELMRLLWPSSVWLMATEGIEGTLRSYFFVLISISANVLLYAVLGSFIGWLKHALIDRVRGR